MRHQWYADHRDLVKWGALFQLAALHDLRTILQIAYLTADDSPPLIASELGESPVDSSVLHHFRNIHRVTELGRKGKPVVRVFDRPFAARSRNDYSCAAVEAVRTLAPRPAAVLLDPDTGMAEKPGSSKHVTASEVADIWFALEPLDWLVLYQHASREAGWLESRRTSFSEALGLRSVLTFQSPNGAQDVAIFAACRTRSPEPANPRTRGQQSTVTPRLGRS